MSSLLDPRWYLLLVLITLAGCSEPPKPQFKTTDVTGADFGKGFVLADVTGKPTSLSDFKGRVVVLFFGFTHCPDVCPGTLSELAAVKRRLGADGDRMQVVFVTLDPERDTVEVLGKYVPAFDPSFVGLTGDAEAIARTAREFKVYYQKVPGTTSENYTLDHTAAAFVFDPTGRLRLFASAGQGPDALVHDIRLLLQEKR